MYNEFAFVASSSVAFAYRVPSDAVTTDYTIRLSSSGIAPLTRSVPIVDFSQNLLVTITSDKTTYNLGERVQGIISVVGADGVIPADATFTLTVRGSAISQTAQRLNAQGSGAYSFVIPTTAFTLTSSEILVQARATNYSGIAAIPIAFNQAITNPVVDYFVENGQFVVGVSNKIYFQAYTDATKTRVLDITGAILKTRQVSGKITTDTNLITGISTQHSGKGSFEYTPGSPTPFLEFTVGALTFSRPLTLTNSTTAEVSMRVLNTNKVLRGSDNLELQFQTNALINNAEAYIVRVQARDLVIYQEQIILNPRAIRNVTIPGSSLPLPNGGVLIVALQRLTNDLRAYATNPPVVVNSTTNVTTLPNAASATVQRWFADKGRVLIYKAPSEVLRVAVRPNKRVYNPGEQVTFDVVVSSSTGRTIPATEDFQVSVEVTETSKTNPAVNNIALSQLGGEILPSDLAFANDYTNAILGTGDARSLDLVLGTQGWRYGAFIDLAHQERIASSISRLSQAEREAFQQLYGFTFNASVPALTTAPLRAPSTYTIPQVNPIG